MSVRALAVRTASAGNAAWRALGDAPGQRLDDLEPDEESNGGSAPEELLRLASFRSAEEVKLALARSQEAALAKWRPPFLELDPWEVPFVAARLAPKGIYGRRGLPRQTVLLMYREYQRAGSLTGVARLYRRSRQAMWEIFKRHGLAMNSRNFHARILFDGHYWTPGKDGYYRETGNRRGCELLHRVLWERRTGRKVPAGWQVTFKNGDNSDFRSGNLVCLPPDQVTRLHYHRRYPGRAGMSRKERRKFWLAHNREYMRRKMAAFVARGLRTDGQPRRRPPEEAT